MRKIYVASSWRNERQPEVVATLRAAGHKVYDFRHPDGPFEADNGFHWSDIDPEWKSWTPDAFRRGLRHDIALAGFGKDMDALDEADLCVLVQPCGINAHLELGYAAGQNKPTIVLLADGEPELMYLMASQVCCTLEEVVDLIEALEEGA